MERNEDESLAPMEPGLYNMDCMEAMAGFPDGFFDLAIVDPPYGCGGAAAVGKADLKSQTDSNLQHALIGGAGHWNGSVKGRFGQRFDRYSMGVRGGWDVSPNAAYFSELARVSKNQIIWGGNYFDLPPTRCFLVWDKMQPENFSMALAEYAWTSFDGNAKIFRHVTRGSLKEPRIHPTQKPVALYSWILRLYAKKGDRIWIRMQAAQAA